jgi:D-alanine-D-alanine ligase
MLEMADIPYVGCGVLASSLAMDKFMSKIIFKAHKLPQANFLHSTREEIKKEFPNRPSRSEATSLMRLKGATLIKKLVTKHIGFPCFVKPSNLGSSVGISKVKKPSELKAALLHASAYDASVLIEEAIDAREIECAVLGNENPIASIAGEIVPNREFYDYFAKYVDNASKLFIPAKISPKKMREVQRISLAAYRSLQCSGMARVDFLMDRKTGKLFLNEINTIPGFTSISMYPKLFEASGIPYPKLIDRLIDLALARHRERSKNKFSFESGSDWYNR